MTVQAAIALHVGMGAVWVLATLVTAVTKRIGGVWPAVLFGAAFVNMLAGIYLWHALHGGAWGRREHLLVVGTFCAFIALGVQVPVALAAPRTGSLFGGAAALHRLSLLLVAAATIIMVLSRID